MADKRMFRVEVTQTVEVELDPTKFDEAFMEEFRESFFPFSDLGDHAEHLAQLEARGVVDLGRYSTEFVEGYGPIKDMGISARVIDTEIQQVSHG
jgi:hypothetical protein